MKDFMLIFISPTYHEMGLSPEDMQQRMRNWWQWQNDMESKGVLKGGHALHPEAKIIANSERTITDRAATEVKELIGGYYIVKAENVEGATEIAQGYPDYDLGGRVEVREVMVFEQ